MVSALEQCLRLMEIVAPMTRMTMMQSLVGLSRVQPPGKGPSVVADHAVHTEDATRISIV